VWELVKLRREQRRDEAVQRSAADALPPPQSASDGAAASDP
jgi:hypothetical protein